METSVWSDIANFRLWHFALRIVSICLNETCENSVRILKIRRLELRRRQAASETWASLHCQPSFSSPESPSRNQHPSSSSLPLSLNFYCLSASLLALIGCLWILHSQNPLAQQALHRMGVNRPCSESLWGSASSWTQAWLCSWVNV